MSSLRAEAGCRKAIAMVGAMTGPEVLLAMAGSVAAEPLVALGRVVILGVAAGPFLVLWPPIRSAVALVGLQGVAVAVLPAVVVVVWGSLVGNEPLPRKD